jgi:hypothetical protein
MIEQVSRAIDKCAQDRGHPIHAAVVRHLAVAAIDAMRPTDAVIERAAEALREYELGNIEACYVKWERLNEKIKQHFRGKVRVVVDAVGEA